MSTLAALDALFREVGFAPNDNQRAAIDHADGPLFLVAGPGSGKTRVLLWRTINLIVFRDVKPERIFLSTFTEKAAKQLRDGLVSLLGVVNRKTGRPFDTSKMYVGTVHSLCHRMLTDRELSPGRARSDAPAVLDELDQYFNLAATSFWRDARAALAFEGTPEAFREVINGHFENGSASRHKAVFNLASLFNRFSEENLQPADLLAKATDADRLLIQLYDIYRRRLLPKRVDLSILQQAALKVITDSDKGGSTFDHVIVDEYQDTNAIQESIFLRLVARSKNLCVVGDDDQALYRFRGATVENFVQFPDRCRQHLGVEPRLIKLNTNYRSRRQIVTFCTRFIEQTDWHRPEGGYYRLHDKDIRPNSQDAGAAVAATTAGSPEAVASEIAGLVRKLLDSKRVSDPNQIAFLFPSLKSVAVERLERALGQVGLKVYAPRAKRFLEADEPTAMIGLLGLILGRPPRSEDFDRGEYREFHNWLDACETTAKELVRKDARLAQFVKERQEELGIIQKDLNALAKVVSDSHWSMEEPYDAPVHKRALLGAGGLLPRARRTLGTAYLDRIVADRVRRGAGVPLRYVISRATSVDWGLLDLFYRIVGFDYFKAMFDAAETGADEGPVCNLALTSQHLARYADTFPSVITATALEGSRLQNGFYHAFLFALFRLSEGEFEDAEDPFPKGRIPFLTIHQSKGLEFPVVVLGNLYPANRSVRRVEMLVRPLIRRSGEPVDRMGDFDAMRMFYVALSRAKNLLVLPHMKGQGQQIDPAFKNILQNGDLARIPSLDVTTLPEAQAEPNEIARRYSYTGDYLAYLRCPRQYMLFHKYGFAASRTQTMFFGSLVHQTIEDLHNRLIARRQAGGAA